MHPGDYNSKSYWIFNGKSQQIIDFAADYLEVEERLIEKLNPTSLCENFVQNVK